MRVMAGGERHTGFVVRPLGGCQPASPFMVFQSCGEVCSRCHAEQEHRDVCWLARPCCSRWPPVLLQPISLRATTCSRRLSAFTAPVSVPGVGWWSLAGVLHGGALAAAGVGVWVSVLAVVHRGPTIGPSLDFLAALALVFAVGAGLWSRRRIAQLLIGVATVSALLALVDGWVDLALPAATRPAGLLGSRSTAAAFTCAALALTVGVRRRAWRNLVTLVLVALLVATRSRAGWGAALIGVLPLAILSRRWGMVIAAAVAIIMMTTLPWPNWHWTGEAPFSSSFSSLLTLELGDRLDVWRATLRQLTVIGWGLGGFEAHFESPSVTTRIEAPHNELLRLAFELGVPGTVGVSVLAITAFARRWRPRTLVVGVALLMLAVAAITGKTLSEPPTLMACAVLLGLLLRGRTSHARAMKGTAALAMCVFSVATIWVDLAQVQSSWRTRSAIELRQRGQLRSAWEELEPALGTSRDLTPWLLAIELLSYSADTWRCHEVGARAKARWPGSPVLSQRVRECGPGP